MNVMLALPDAPDWRTAAFNSRGSGPSTGQRSTATPGRTSGGVQPSARDAVSLSPLSSLAAASGLDLARSWACCSAGSRLEFNLEFGTSQSQRVTARGVYSAESQAINLSLSYTMQAAVSRDGQTTQPTYQVELRLHASHTRSASAEAYEEKEDIVSLVRRVVSSMLDVARSDDQRLAGVVFDPVDLAELAAIDGGRTLMAVVHLIQQIVMYSYQLKQLRTDTPGDPIEDVVLTPQRWITQGVKTEYNEAHVQEVALEIREISSG